MSVSRQPLGMCGTVCCYSYREETEIIEGEVVEVQIDRPTTTAVSVITQCTFSLFTVC